MLKLSQRQHNFWAHHNGRYIYIYIFVYAKQGASWVWKTEQNHRRRKQKGNNNSNNCHSVSTKDLISIRSLSDMVALKYVFVLRSEWKGPAVCYCTNQRNIFDLLALGMEFRDNIRFFPLDYISTLLGKITRSRDTNCQVDQFVTEYPTGRILFSLPTPIVYHSANAIWFSMSCIL